jgi:hypothetical protein
MRDKMSGDISNDRIILWEGANSIGPMYPICKIDFDTKGAIVSIKSELNILGKILYVAISTFYLLYGGHLVLKLNDTNLVIPYFVAAGLIALLFRAFKWVNDKTKTTLAKFVLSKSRLNSEHCKNVITIGAPLKKLLFRIYFYLFFIFLFCVSLLDFLHWGSWYQIIGMAIGGCFVIAESIIIYNLSHKVINTLEVNNVTSNIIKDSVVNNKIILVDNVEYNLIKQAVQDFTDMYDNPEQFELKPISKLYKPQEDQTLIIFPYNIDFEIFCYLINYIKYPIDLKYKANVLAWTTTKPDDPKIISEVSNRNVMLYIDPNDIEYDNVMLIAENEQTYKIRFAVGKGFEKYSETILKYKSFDLSTFELNKLESQEIK